MKQKNRDLHITEFVKSGTSVPLYIFESSQIILHFNDFPSCRGFVAEDDSRRGRHLIGAPSKTHRA